MIRLILARHGNTFEKGQVPTQVGLNTDLPLTLQGREQAEELANYLSSRKLSPVAIYAGSLKRQTEAAQIVSKHAGCDKLHLNEDSLTEIDFGDWEGLTSKEISSKWPNEYANWNAEGKWVDTVFGGSVESHLKRIEKWLGILRKKYSPGDTVVGITSNGLIRFFYSLQKEEWNRFVKERQVETLKVKTGHFCELSLFEDSLKVVSWNQSPLK